jgi:hypothetical protein
VQRADAPWRQAVSVPAGTTGPVIETREYYLPAGGSDILLKVALDTAAEAPWGTLELLDATTNEVVASAPVRSGATTGWHDVTVHPALPPQPALVRFRLSSLGTSGFSIANVALPVDYAFKVVDLTADLNTFDTHASVFDAHPNEQAHKLMAEKVYDALKEAEARH